jgi:hypothetical protein
MAILLRFISAARRSITHDARVRRWKKSWIFLRLPRHLPSLKDIAVVVAERDRDLPFMWSTT